jgi:hypothetical protein
MDADELAHACENENNAHILLLTNDKIEQDKLDILNELPIGRDDKLMLIDKLDGYMYVDEIHEIHAGCYLRWINTQDPDDIYIATGAIFCEMVFTDMGTALRMKNFRHRYFELKMDDALLFQKLTSQEKVILAALSYMT